MGLPPLIDTKSYLIPNSNGELDKINLVKNAFEIFENDFINNKVVFDSYRVRVRENVLFCEKCNYTCKNDFCTCDDCPWIHKFDIFNHVTTDEDKDLENRLTKTYKRKLKRKRETNPKAKERTPGIFSKSRTIRIPWLKHIIENTECADIQVKINQISNSNEVIKIYFKKQQYLIIISRTTLKDGNKELFLNSAYHKPYMSLLRGFH